MTIAVFTSNQPRHIALIRELSKHARTIYAVIEATTVFPGQLADFYDNSEALRRYFLQVIEAEKHVFGPASFLPGNCRSLVLRMGDLNHLDQTLLEPVFTADQIVVFGSSFIRGNLCDALIKKRSINIHMGIAPYYRGNGCNFWALFDQRPELVGATIHLLGKGLDSGEVIAHCFPKESEGDGFLFGMQAVKAAISGVAYVLTNSTTLNAPMLKQDKSLQIRYTKKSDFTEEIARQYLDGMVPGRDAINHRLGEFERTSLAHNPIFV